MIKSKKRNNINSASCNNSGTFNTELTTDSTNIGNYMNNKWNIINDKAKYTIDGESWNNCAHAKTEAEAILLTTGASDSFLNYYK